MSSSESDSRSVSIAIIGPVHPYRGGISYCTTRLAEELSKTTRVELISFHRQFPALFYPGKADKDPTLAGQTPSNASFRLDILNPATWITAGVRLRRSRPDVLILVWWIWVWAIPYLVLIALLRRRTRVVLQCHNIGDKEPARWKTWLTNRVLRRGDALVVHARTEADEAARRLGEEDKVVPLFLPVLEIGTGKVSRDQARKDLGIAHPYVALFFGNVRPCKALDIALDAWSRMERDDIVLLVAGEVWWNDEERYREQAKRLGVGSRVRFDLRFIPDDEVARYFAAADVVIAPYRTATQSGVVLTSLHFERPVIATTVGGLPEVIRDGENGLLIPPEDSSALASAVAEFFDRCDRGSMERNAAESAKKYSWDRYAAGMLDVIKRKDRS